MVMVLLLFLWSLLDEDEVSRTRRRVVIGVGVRFEGVGGARRGVQDVVV